MGIDCIKCEQTIVFIIFIYVIFNYIGTRYHLWTVNIRLSAYPCEKKIL
jgi:hypothetical protein